MSREPLEHGLTYVARDGSTTVHLDRLLADPEGERIPRPERDVLLALLRFCVEGVEHMNATEAAR